MSLQAKLAAFKADFEAGKPEHQVYAAMITDGLGRVRADSFLPERRVYGKPVPIG
jgi:hypothetical protein